MSAAPVIAAPARAVRPVPDLAQLGVPLTTRQVVGGFALLAAVFVVVRRLLERPAKR